MKKSEQNIVKEKNIIYIHADGKKKAPAAIAVKQYQASEMCRATGFKNLWLKPLRVFIPSLKPPMQMLNRD